MGNKYIKLTTFKCDVNVKDIFKFTIYYRREVDFSPETIKSVLNSFDNSEEVNILINKLKNLIDLPTNEILSEENIFKNITERSLRNDIFNIIYQIKSIFINMLDGTSVSS